MKSNITQSRMRGGSFVLIAMAIFAWLVLKPEPSVPIPPPQPTDPEETVAAFNHVERWRDVRKPHQSLVVVQVLTLYDEPPPWEYQIVYRFLPFLRREFPRPLGKMRVLETLVGTQRAGAIVRRNCSDTYSLDCLDLIDPDQTDSSGSREAQKGEYWLLSIDATRLNHTDWIAGLPLSGPDDPILKNLKRSLTWESVSDRSKTIQEAAAILSDRTAPLLDRDAALDTLRWACGQTRQGHHLEYYYAEVNCDKEHQALQNSPLAAIVTDTLAQPDLPDALRFRLIQCCWPDISHPLDPHSNDVQQMHYLLKTVQSSHNFEAVHDASRQLDCIRQQLRPIPPTVNYFREIGADLARRKADDLNLRHPNPYVWNTPSLYPRTRNAVTFFSEDLRKQYGTAPLQPIPAIGTDTLSQELMAAAAK